VDATRGNFVVITVPKFKHLGCDGQLQATFVFDRLMEVDFSPSDDDRYRNALARLGISFKQNDDVVVRGDYTKVVSGHLGNRRFYEWIDTRLKEGWNDWAERHSG